MVQGIGTDIIEIKRIRAAIDRHQHHFLDRVFSLSEQKYCLQYKDPAPYFSGRFSAKEAIVKALGTGFRDGITWLDIEILNNTSGKPEVILSKALRQKFPSNQILISISHCREYATATAILL